MLKIYLQIFCEKLLTKIGCGAIIIPG